MTVVKVTGSIPHGVVADKTFPIVIGGLATTSAPAVVDNGDAVQAYIDEYGRYHVSADAETTSPTIYNVTLTSADTEYSQAMPENCRFFEFQCRTAFAVRYAYVTGKVATPTAPYMTLKSGNYYYSPVISQAATPSTLYLASAQAGVVVEIVAWT